MRRHNFKEFHTKTQTQGRLRVHEHLLGCSVPPYSPYTKPHPLGKPPEHPSRGLVQKSQSLVVKEREPGLQSQSLAFQKPEPGVHDGPAVILGPR